MIRQLRLILIVALLASASTVAQVPVAELAKPPANARHFIIMSTGRETPRLVGVDCPTARA